MEGSQRRQRHVARAPVTLLNPTPSAARNSLAVSMSSLFAAVFAVAQALLIVLIAGRGPATDGFFAAYALYLPIALFGASLRVSVVPLLGAAKSEAEFREHANEIVGRILQLGLVLATLLL